MVYHWKRGSHTAGNAQVVGEYLDSLRRVKGGFLSPKEVVAAGQAEASPIHDYFEWDDGVAAEAYRVEQAGDLMRSVVVSVDRGLDKKPLVVRAFVSVTNHETGKPTYASVTEAMSDAALRDQVLRQAKMELKAWRDRYRELEELSGIIDIIDRAAERDEGWAA